MASLKIFRGFTASGLWAILSVAVLTCLPLANAKAADWRAIPIVDAHFHLMLFMTADQLLERMDRHNILVTISGGAIGSPQQGNPNMREMAAAPRLGSRYLPAAGNYELNMLERNEGASFYSTPGHAGAGEALQRIRQHMQAQPRVFAETFPNAERSQQDPKFRRRVPADGPVFQEMMKISAAVQRPLLLHMEWHPDSVAQLSRLLEQHPQGSVMLAHCGKTTRAADIRPFLQKHANAVCDLSFRSFPQEEKDYSRFPERTIFWPSTPKYAAALDDKWRALIEEMPDRFMVGIDDVHDWAQYDEVVRSIREGLLANLTPATMAKVAHENARRVFRLTQ